MDSGGLSPREQVTHLWFTIFGVTGSNGLRGTVLGHTAQMSEIDRKIARLEMVEAQIHLVVRIVQWAALALSTAVAFLASAPVAEFLGNIIKAGAGK